MAAVGAALLLDTCSLLQPAQFFLKKRSSEKSEVLGHGERVGGEELRRRDLVQACHVATHHAARRHSPLVAVSAVHRGGRPAHCQRGAGAAKLAAVARPRPSMSAWTRRPQW